jgi:hypothetical protein
LYSTILLYLQRLDQTESKDRIEQFIDSQINKELLENCNSVLEELSSMDNIKMEEKIQNQIISDLMP